MGLTSAVINTQADELSSVPLLLGIT